VNWAKPIANFTGVDGNKIRMGLLASTSAGGSNYYTNQTEIAKFRTWLKEKGYPLNGFMMWDSHWDTLNNHIVSKACK
jgi:chitinase